MKKSLSVLLLIGVIGCVSSQSKNAQTDVTVSLKADFPIPSNVKYNKKDLAFNLEAANKIKELLANKDIIENDFSSFVTCGPFLWKRISSQAVFKALNGPEMNIANIGLTGKIIMNDQQGLIKLWEYLKSKIKSGTNVTIRNLTEEELSIYWGCIMFDIEDPLFMIDNNSNTKVLIELSEEMQITYLDDFYGISLKK